MIRVENVCDHSRIDTFFQYSTPQIAGTGGKLKKARQLAKPNKYIKFLGWKNKEEIRDLMESSDCLIVPSLCYENSPTVIYEAASCFA